MIVVLVRAVLAWLGAVLGCLKGFSATNIMIVVPVKAVMVCLGVLLGPSCGSIRSNRLFVLQGIL